VKDRSDYVKRVLFSFFFLHIFFHGCILFLILLDIDFQGLSFRVSGRWWKYGLTTEFPPAVTKSLYYAKLEIYIR